MPVIEKLKKTKSLYVDWLMQAFWYGIFLRFWPPAQKAKNGLALGDLCSIWVLYYMHTRVDAMNDIIYQSDRVCEIIKHI